MTTDATTVPADGTAAVRDGRLVVTDPVGAGRPARVRPGPGVEIRGADVPDRGAVTVTTGAPIEVDPGSTEPMSAIDVEVPQGGLEAILTVRVSDGVEYALEDRDPAAEVTLVRREVRRLPADRPTDADVRRALADRSVVRDIDEDAIAAALATCDGQPVVVARGRAPVPPTDARLDVPAGLALARSPLATVAAGTVLAVRHPPAPGVEGYTVGGTALAPARPREATLTAGPGAEAEEADDGTVTVRAAIDGRPVVRGSQVGVEPLVRVAAIDMATGDVALRSSLEVAGGVEEGRRVRVLRDLEVHGVVERAELVAGGSITLTGPCMHSRLHAGGPQAVYVRLLALIDGAGEELVGLAGAAAELIEAAGARGRQVGEPEAIGALLASRFAGTRERLLAGAKLVEAQPEGLLPDHLATAMQETAALVGSHDPPESLEAVDRAGHLIQDEVTAMRGAVAGPAGVRVAYMQGCEVSAPGDLVVTGRGCFNCEIAVGGDLECAAAGATLRGGTARVGGRVRLAELGAPGMTPVTLVLEGATDTPDRLLAERVHEGAVVVCNGEILTVGRDMTAVRVGTGPDGRAVIHGEPMLRG